MFKVDRVREKVYSIMDPAGVRAFLIEGKDRAALIDTCCGVGNLRAEADRLTALPYEVILTHGHVDHAGGAGGFGTCCLSQADWALTETSTTIERRYRFVNNNYDPPRYPRELFVPQRHGGYTDFPDGSLYELGGLTLEAIAIPGHTPGMTGILLREYGTLILGDACNSFTFMFLEESTDIRTYMKSLRRLQTRRQDFDTAWSSHGGVDCPLRVIEDVLETCEVVLERRDDAVPFESMGRHGFIAAARDARGRRLDGKVGNLIYRPDKIT